MRVLLRLLIFLKVNITTYYVLRVEFRDKSSFFLLNRDNPEGGGLQANLVHQVQR